MLSLNEIGMIILIVFVLVLIGQWENVARHVGKNLRRRAQSGFDPNMRRWAEQIVRQRMGASFDVCYHLLGLTPTASQKDIKKAYRSKAKKFHPDHGGDPDMMDALTMAYEKLMDREDEGDTKT
jgi:hypothetical protein